MCIPPGLGHVDALNCQSVEISHVWIEDTHSCPYCVIGFIVLQRVIQMQRLCAFGDEVLCFSVDQADHGALGVKAPRNQLCVGREDRVWGLGFRRGRAGCWRAEVLVQLSRARSIAGGFVVQLWSFGRVDAFDCDIRHGCHNEGEKEEGCCKAMSPAARSWFSSCL
jgi:hypothetical protein